MLNKEIRQQLKDLGIERFPAFKIYEKCEIIPAMQHLSCDLAEIDGIAKRVGNRSLIEIHLDMNMSLECHRCLTKMVYPFDLALEKEIEDQDIDAFVFSRWVQEELILQTPLRIICKADCKGLCSNCGQNLNNGTCGCNKKQKASPFDVLDDLFD